ncbi:hypothetical protein IFM89_001880 [Coptis chinensis]|uniref:C2H2-type domain-containing protein n=1 Tax=Coptis chinensis TaxID=261450 RepID=A0A835IJS8_9MAGN|nr:hypothetical protein IFM89_001880 [Coptis chinensis]
MGNKKGNKSSSSRRNQNTTPAPTYQLSLDEIKFSKIKSAFTYARQGSHVKALKIMNELHDQEGSENAYLYEVQAEVEEDIASCNDNDPDFDEKYMKKAILNARKAVKLSPKSIEFAWFYCYLISVVANDCNACREVIQECERALAMSNPNDPADECLVYNGLPTAAERIEALRYKITLLIKDCKEKRYDMVSAYWKSLNLDEQLSSLHVSDSDLKAYLSSLENKDVSVIMIDYLSFVEAHQQWNFWECWYCGKKFDDSELHFWHVKKHLWKFSSKHKKVLPSSPDQDWCSMISDGKWRPVNTSAVLPIFEEQLKWVSSVRDKGSTNRENMVDKKDSPIDDSLRTSTLETSTNSLSLHPIYSFVKEIYRLTKTMDLKDTDELLNIKERDVLDNDDFCIVINKQSLPGEITFTDEDMEQPNSDVLLKWILTGLSIEEPLAPLVDPREERKSQVDNLYQTLGRNIATLQALCEEKCDNLSYKEALAQVWGACCNELYLRKDNTEHVPESYETILQRLESWRRRLLNLRGADNFRLRVITDILKESQSLAVGDEQILLTTGVCDWEIHEDSDAARQGSLHQAETFIIEAVRRVSKNIDLELMKKDAWINRTAKEIEKLELNITLFAADDYRVPLSHIAQPYILAQLEERADKDAAEKSDAVKEATKAIFTPNAGETVSKGNGQIQKKSKNKGKKKHKKTTELKVLVLYLFCSLPFSCRSEKQVYVASDAHPDMETIGTSGGDDLNQNGEDFKLEEKLENLRQYENAAKQNVLAQNKDASESSRD